MVKVRKTLYATPLFIPFPLTLLPFTEKYCIGICNTVDEDSFAFVAITYSFTSTFAWGKKNHQRLRTSNRSFPFLPLRLESSV